MAEREQSNWQNTITAILFIMTLLVLAFAVNRRMRLLEAGAQISLLEQQNKNFAAQANAANERFAQLLEDHRRMQRDFAEIPKLRGELSRLRRGSGNYQDPEPQPAIKETVKARGNRIRETLARITKTRKAPESPDEFIQIVGNSAGADLLAGCTVELARLADEHHGPKFKITGTHETGTTWTLFVDESSYHYVLRRPNSI